MTIDQRLSREQCEKAFAAYVLKKQADELAIDPATDVAPALQGVGVFIRKGKFNDQGQYELENPEEIPLPAICIAVPRAREHAAGYPVCELHVIVMNATDEKTGTTQASRRFGWAAGLFNEDMLDAIQLALNKPGEGTDERVVQNFTVFGMYMTEDLGQEVERHWIDHLVYEVHCFPSDEFDAGDAEILVPPTSGVIITCDDTTFNSKNFGDTVHDATITFRNRLLLANIILSAGSFTTVRIFNCPVLVDFEAGGQLVGQVGVDQVLIDLLANAIEHEIHDGICNLNGSGVPTQAGLDAKVALENDWEWEVAVDS